MMVLAFSRVRR